MKVRVRKTNKFKGIDAIDKAEQWLEKERECYTFYSSGLSFSKHNQTASAYFVGEKTISRKKRSRIKKRVRQQGGV